MKTILGSCFGGRPQTAFNEQTRKVKINQSMISAPQDFQHTGHLGWSKMEETDVNLLRAQMIGKGGYNENRTSPTKSKPAES